MQKRHALPKQTQNYVPIIIALALVAKDPVLYGVQVDPEKPPQVETVKPEHPMDLHLVADATGADLDDLQAAESATVAQRNAEGFCNSNFGCPPGTRQKFEENIQQVPEDKWTSWRLHSVEKRRNAGGCGAALSRDGRCDRNGKSSGGARISSSGLSARMCPRRRLPSSW